MQCLTDLTGRPGTKVGHEYKVFCVGCSDAASRKPAVALTNTTDRDGVMISFRCGCDRDKVFAKIGIRPDRGDLTYSPTGRGLVGSGLAKSNFDLTEAIDAFYRGVLERCPLSTENRQALLDSGWTPDVIDSVGYGTWDWFHATKALAEVKEVYPPSVVRDIPGIEERQTENGAKLTVKRLPDGTIIPSRLDGKITALRLRKDTPDDYGKYLYLSGGNKDGTNKVSPSVHVPLATPDGDIEEVRIVEGEKKADYCAAMDFVPSVSVPGVDSWPVVLPWLEARKVKRVRVAFDADARENTTVARQLYCAAKVLTERGYAVGIEVWPRDRGKGIDDLLSVGESPALIAENPVDYVRLLALATGCTQEELDSAKNATIKDTPAPEKAGEPAPKAKKERKGSTPREDKLSAADDALCLMDELEMVGILGPDGVTYLSWNEGSGIETVPSNSQGFLLRFMAKYQEARGKVISADAIKNAALTRVGQSLDDAQDNPVELRLARRGEKTYLDLANRERQVIEIDAEGWSLAEKCPVRFLRKDGMASMPVPQRGGELAFLRPYINTDDAGYRLLLGWLVQAYHPTGPYCHLLLKGSAGSAKSTVSRIAKSLVDPMSGELGSFPPTERDLMISALNSRVLAFDNLVRIEQDMSDALCRLATGGGVRVRKLYSDTDEIFLDARRPIILNGIPDVVTQSDLSDRVISIELERITEGKRRDEESLKRGLADDYPFILGALLDAVSMALRDRGKVTLARCPRVADAARFITAAEPAMGLERGTWLKDYWEMRGELDLSVAEGDSFAVAIRKLMEGREEVEMTPTELLLTLQTQSGRQKDWPNSPNTMTSRIKRLKPTLSELGIQAENITVGRGNDRQRVWILKKTE